MKPRVVVIGAGPAGLTVSAALLRRGIEVVCLESAARAGGALGTVRRDGFLAETGPHSLRLFGANVPEALALAGLGDRLLDADVAANKRYVTCGGRPVAAPSSPVGAMSTPLLSLAGKLRFAAEPFIRRAPEGADESVAQFVRRRLGPEALDRLVDAVVGGIYAGDPEKLSVRHAMPMLHRFDREHGSLVLGALATRGERKARGRARVVGLPAGMAELPEALAAAAGEALRLNAVVRAVEKTSGGWRVAWSEPGAPERSVSADRVVIAAPPGRWGPAGLPESLAEAVSAGASVPCPPVAVVTLGYPRERVAHPLDGFGVLSPAAERRKALGVLFPSSLFPGRAPAGAVTLAAFIGGARQPGLGRLPPPELERLAREECASLLGAQGAPAFVHVARWERAIPQYDMRHGDFLAALEKAESALPGLHFCGNFRGGVALGATLDNAAALAARIAG